MYATLSLNIYVIKTLVFLTFNPSFVTFYFFFKERGKGEGEGEGDVLGGDEGYELEGEDVEMIGGDDDEDEGAVDGADVEEEESSSSSSSDNDKEEDLLEKKKRMKESEVQRKVKKFWKERGRVNYGCEWQTYSPSHIKECVQQLNDLKHRIYNVVRRDHFEWITVTTYTLGNKKEEIYSKYLHLKSSDNDLAQAIEHHLNCKDCSLIYVITFYIIFIY